MATRWTNAAWHEQATNEAKLAMLCRYMAELEQALNVNLAADGQSVSHDVIRARLADLTIERTNLETVIAASSGGFFVRTRQR